MRDLLKSILGSNAVALTRPWTGEIVAQSFSGVTDPSNASGRDARHERERKNVAGDNSTGGNKAVRAEARSADDRGIRSNRDSALYHRVEKFVLALDFGPRVLDVGENAAWA